jgi:hypothetical protein
MKLFLVVLLTVFSFKAFSNTLIISDIDDTIKISHVRDQIDLVANAMVTTAPFKGMSELFVEILTENPESEIIYVTNADDFWMHGSHTNFIRNNNFPEGKIFFRTGGSETHKYDTIKKYLNSHPSIDKVIMLGDNGEKDISSYSKIEKEFENRLTFKTYIRTVYSTPETTLPLEKNQIAFISPLEILTDLALNNFLNMEDYFNFAESFSQQILDEPRTYGIGPQYFPSWLNCKNMNFSIYPQLMTPLITKAYDKLQSLCQ